MIIIAYYANLMDMSIFKDEYSIELSNDSLAKYINIGDIVFGKDNEEFNYKVKDKTYHPINELITLFVCRE